jgi:hypothetical protein
MRDADIDTSDIPPLDEEFFKKATIRMPERKLPVTLRVDKEALVWFKSQGKGYQSRMNAVLKAYARDKALRTRHDDSLFGCLLEKGLIPHAHAIRDRIKERGSVWAFAR